MASMGTAHLSSIQSVCVLAYLCCCIFIRECQEAKAPRSASVLVSARTDGFRKVICRSLLPGFPSHSAHQQHKLRCHPKYGLD